MCAPPCKAPLPLQTGPTRSSYKYCDTCVQGGARLQLPDVLDAMVTALRQYPGGLTEAIICTELAKMVSIRHS